MASPKPTSYYPWATDTLTQDIEVEGVSYTIDNKFEPILALQDDGYLYSEIKGMPLQYMNWQMSAPAEWVAHLDQRYAVGDLFKTFNNLTQQDVEDQLGGTWTLLGTVVETPGTFYYWEKTA